MPAPSAAALAPADLHYPEHLPVAARREDIAAAIRDHQVVIVAGETGSGKTTQLPKICLELGRGGDGGMIGHTQPRRHRRPQRSPSGSPRSSDVELGGIGRLPGALHRPDQRARRRVKLMTDGILLAEMQRDRLPAALRHDHHRRGARAQPQHRLPARLPQAAAAAAARPQGHHHLGHHRPASASPSTSPTATGDARRRSSRSPGRTYPVEVRYRPLRRASPTAADDDGEPVQRDRDARRSSTRSTSSPSARRPATSWCSCRASARSATPPTRSTRRLTTGCARHRGPAAVRPALGRRAAPGLRAGTRGAGSCSPPTSPRPR